MIDYNNVFGNALETLRLKYDLTQKMLSYFLDGHPSHTQISRYERGENLPEHLDDVEAIADAIVCTPAEKDHLLLAFAIAKARRNGTADLLAAIAKVWADRNGTPRPRADE